jgi:hypothetical protein
LLVKENFKLKEESEKPFNSINNSNKIIKMNKELNISNSNEPFEYLNKKKFASVVGNSLADYSSYARVIMIASDLSEDVESTKQKMLAALSDFAAAYQFAETDDEFNEDSKVVWLYFHSASEFAYYNETFRDLSGELNCNLKCIDPDKKVYQAYSWGDFDTGMYYAQNNGDFAMWNAWEDFDKTSELNEEYYDFLDSILLDSPVEIQPS